MEPANNKIQNIAWLEKYRPKTKDDFIYEDESQKKMVEKWLEERTIDGNILLYGPAGIGKTSLAHILILGIIKSSGDLLKLQSRSVKEIDKLVPFLTKKPQLSNINIIYIEEFDRLSSEAKDQLKDDLMEKYINNTIFIATTNNPRRIPYPLLTRFTYRWGFKGKNTSEITNRLKEILKNENAEYNIDELSNFVEQNYSKGIRELINIIQNSYISNSGKIDFNVNYANISSSLEENIVGLINNMIQTCLKLTDIQQKRLVLIDPIQSCIGVEYQQFYKTLNNNLDIDYENILDRCFNDVIKFVPMQMIVGKYADNLEQKKYPHIHIVAMLYELFKCAIEINN